MYFPMNKELSFPAGRAVITEGLNKILIIVGIDRRRDPSGE
jgi:hypothetical protein